MSKAPARYFVAALLCVAFANAYAGDRVGNPVLRQISEAIALSRLCPELEADDGRISELVRQASLSQASVARALDETMGAILDDAPAAQLQPALCSLALVRYGPKGSQLAGLVRSIAAAAASAPAEPIVPTRKVKTITIVIPKTVQ